MTAITLESVVVRREGPMSAPVDGDLVLLDPRQGLYFGLDAVGHRVWDLLEQPRTVAALCATLSEEFDVSREACAADVLGFIAELADADLLELR